MAIDWRSNDPLQQDLRFLKNFWRAMITDELRIGKALGGKWPLIPKICAFTSSLSTNVFNHENFILLFRRRYFIDPLRGMVVMPGEHFTSRDTTTDLNAVLAERRRWPSTHLGKHK